jgi:peptide/nickel transport system permease protein
LWISGLLRGNPGTSLANGQAISNLVSGRIVNSAVLVVCAGILGTVLALGLGILAAARRDSWLDNTLSVTSLAVTALPEFVVAIALIIVFSTNLLHLFPAVSTIPPGQPAWQDPSSLVLPVATLVIVILPYMFRMMRGATVEALESDYVEMAKLKGVRRGRILMRHALPNAIAPTIQVVGLNILYLAGGIVVVEYMFNYPGIGQALVMAVSDRDIPMIQFIVLVLAAFYVFVNIVSDVIALWATPRRRFPR